MPETIGQRLKKARVDRNQSLVEVEKATHIRVQFLQALEADDLSALPSPVQARGFLRNYAEYLGFDLDQVVEELRASQPEPTSDTEVVFEGEQSVPPAKQPGMESESEIADSESPVEPFWQTWLKRVRSEAGEAGELPLPGTEPETESGSEPDSALNAETALAEFGEAPEENSDLETRLSFATTFLEWARSYLSGRGSESDDAPTYDNRDETEPEPEPEPLPDPVVEDSTQPVVSSHEIINEIAQQLRQRREMLSLTLDEIERHTRMRAQFMEALEKGKFDELPSPVQTRGMLSNYASFLDLDVDALLLRFADALQARHRERYPERQKELRKQSRIPESLPRLRTFIAGDLVFGIGMVLLLVAFSVWGISRVIVLQSEQDADVQADTSGPSISEALIGTPQETIEAEVTLIPAEDTPIPGVPETEGTIEIPTLSPNVNVQVNIVALERSYLQVIVDGEVEFDGRTIPGNAYPFDAEQSVEVLAGNGAALRVVYNQRDLGLLGGFGQIARYIYTSEEVIVPTPEVPPTATLTPFLSPTPSTTPSPTITPSPTWTPTTSPGN